MATPVDTPPRVTATSGSVEQLIEDEHATIRAHLSHLRDLARDLPTGDEITARQRVGAVLDFLTGGLLPHAAAEEAVLYPAIDGLLGTGATKTMTLDHEAISGLVTELDTAVRGHLGPEQRAEAQRLLLVLEGLVSTHLWKEDVAYLPLLAQLDPAAYTALHASIAAHVGDQGHAH
jgi:iron-sulfur cluster repair protein YtfE (RIC family)